MKTPVNIRLSQDELADLVTIQTMLEERTLASTLKALIEIHKKRYEIL